MAGACALAAGPRPRVRVRLPHAASAVPPPSQIRGPSAIGKPALSAAAGRAAQRVPTPRGGDLVQGVCADGAARLPALLVPDSRLHLPQTAS